MVYDKRRYQQQQGQCQINRLNPQEPSFRLQAKVGVTEVFDPNNQQFQCVGFSLFRHIIPSRGLLLPSYTNSPLLAYVVQGFYGIMNSGYPETFQSSQQTRRGIRSRRFQGRHQRIEQFRRGDIMAFPAGAAHWVYNQGNQEVVLEDASNSANQLDQNARRFFIVGNPQQGRQQQQGRRYRGPVRREQCQSGNVFSGCDVEILSTPFGVDGERARKLQGQDDMRGHIVSVQEGLISVIRPPFSQEQEEEQQEQGQYGPMNGIEETICSAKVRENIDISSRVDIYARRFSTVNSFTLPILKKKAY
ncbi:11S globulin seed storage protein Jug r 4-like [Lycium barbarum]|uniref:11S globulin seed storage protein Jug r 4-like n=1 Tax=Lycium barbarum TaxID=112863 RepID=UPI00293E473D|nr:11S globulin seed storage protein Jug r 4-like [Lycium barbarum]